MNKYRIIQTQRSPDRFIMQKREMLLFILPIWCIIMSRNYMETSFDTLSAAKEALDKIIDHKNRQMNTTVHTRKG